MHAPLGAEQAVGVFPRDLEGGRLDARFLPGAHLQQLSLEAASLGPAHHHAQHHLGPVLRVGAARARVDADERVARVIGAREQALLLELRQALLDRGEVLLDLLLERRLLLGHLHETVEILDVGLQLRECLQALVCLGVLGRDLGCRLGVVPETGRLHLRFERLDALAQLSWVKDSPLAV